MMAVYSQKFINKIRSRENKVFNSANASSSAMKIQQSINAPFVRAKPSSLGGDDRVSILFTASLDKQEDWSNGYIENSRYARFHLHNDGTLELFSGRTQGTFRKARTTSVDDAIKRVNDYLEKEKKLQ